MRCGPEISKAKGINNYADNVIVHGFTSAMYVLCGSVIVFGARLMYKFSTETKMTSVEFMELESILQLPAIGLIYFNSIGTLN